MASEGSMWSSPFFWVALSAIFFGSGWGRALRPYKKGENATKYKARGVSLLFFLLGLASASALCAFFMPSPTAFFDFRLSENLELLSYQVLSYQENTARLELRAIDLTPVSPIFPEINGDHLDISFSIIEFSEYFSAFGIRKYIRIDNISSTQGSIKLSFKQSLLESIIGTDWIAFSPGMILWTDTLLSSPKFSNSESISFRINKVSNPFTMNSIYFYTQE
jgi:hypothetical protein